MKEPLNLKKFWNGGGAKFTFESGKGWKKLRKSGSVKIESE